MRVEDVHQVAERRGEQPDDGRQRACDGADQLAAQHVRGRERREALDLVLADRRPVENPTADLEDLGVAGGVAQRLGDGDGIAVRLQERDCRRSFQQCEQRVRPGLLGRAAGERVLDDLEAGAVLEELARSLSMSVTVRPR